MTLDRDDLPDHAEEVANGHDNKDQLHDAEAILDADYQSDKGTVPLLSLGARRIVLNHFLDSFNIELCETLRDLLRVQELDASANTYQLNKVEHLFISVEWNELKRQEWQEVDDELSFQIV